MKISDVMKHITTDEKGLALSPNIAENQNIHDLSLDDIYALPEVVPVINQMGQQVGTVARELLLFLSQACNTEFFAQVMNKFEDGVVAIDGSGRIFYVNDAYTKILGVSKLNVLGKQIQTIEPGATILQVLQGGKPILGKVVEIKSLKHYVTVNIFPLYARMNFVVSIFRDVTETKQLNQALGRAEGLAEYFRSELEAHKFLVDGSIVGNHPSFLNIMAQSMTVSKTDASVLLFGENGVGKEVVAKAIHLNSNRSNKPLISVNCAAIPEYLLESELFGYEEGSFTGAKRGGKLGKFELADGGTLFLDEVGDMSMSMQSKLLRVLQEKEIEKIGRTRNVPVDVRIVAATNRHLEEMVKQGTFRIDLYYRLNVVALRIPSLRERGEDIALLAHHFLQTYNAKYSKSLILSPETIRCLNNYAWPGNVRELQNCLEYAVIMCSGKEIRLEHLPAQLNLDIATLSHQNSGAKADFQESVDLTEKELIRKALDASGNNKTKAIEMLGISRRTFYRKLKKFGFP